MNRTLANTFKNVRKQAPRARNTGGRGDQATMIREELLDKLGPHLGHKPRALMATSGHSRALATVGQQEDLTWQAGSYTPDLPSP